MEYILIVLLGVVVLILLTAALVPIRVEVRFNQDWTKFSLKVWLYVFAKKIDLLPENGEKRKKVQKTDKNPQKTDVVPTETGETAEAPSASDADKPKKKFDITQLPDLIDEFSGEALYLIEYLARNSVNAEQFDIKMSYSLDDPFYTGIVTGALNALVYQILGIIHRFTLLKEADVEIQPVFEGLFFKTDFGCIVKARNVHIIYIAVRALILYMKIKRRINKEEL